MNQKVTFKFTFFRNENDYLAVTVTRTDQETGTKIRTGTVTETETVMRTETVMETRSVTGEVMGTVMGT